MKSSLPSAPTLILKGVVDEAEKFILIFNAQHFYMNHSESSSESSGSEESADEDASNYNRYRSHSIPLEVPSGICSISHSFDTRSA